MKNIYGMSLLDLENYFLSLGEKKFKASQVYDWLYVKKTNSFTDMSNIKKDLILLMEKDLYIKLPELISEEHGKDVSKFLFRLEDGLSIEAVLMYHDYGNSLCVSSQVGCNMGCSFCESGRLKKQRDLSAAEMLGQVLLAENLAGKRISHVVVMGIGEPFDNYDNLIKFIEIINHDKGLAIGSRHITVSTCGIVPRIYDFANLPYQVNLAISLHAPNDKLRQELMPIAKAYPLKELLKALRAYIAKTNRRLTFEYICIDGVNDRPEHALELAKLLRGLNAYVNLIPYNETSHFAYKRSKKENIMLFYDIMKKEKMTVTIRREFGSSISAACGQLRSKKEEL